MIDNKDIWRVAKLLVKTHGENAESISAQHVDERLAEGDLVGRDIWRQVLAARGLTGRNSDAPAFPDPFRSRGMR